MRRLLALATLAACGDNRVAPPDAPRADAARSPDAPMLCSATFAGNFALSEMLPADCAMVSAGSAGTTLAFSVAAQPIGTDVMIAIGLPDPPAAGTFSSDSVPSWSAMATQDINNAHCFYVAGTTAVPPGELTLTLDTIGASTAHGQLMLELAVLPGAETDCGSDNAETVALEF
jgi:hypothetical protein